MFCSFSLFTLFCSLFERERERERDKKCILVYWVSLILVLVIVKDTYTAGYTYICERKRKDGHVWIFAGSVFISHGGSAKHSIFLVVIVVVFVGVGVYIRTVTDTEFRG